MDQAKIDGSADRAPRRHRALAALVAAAFTTVSCGGGGGGDSTTASTSPQTAPSAPASTPPTDKAGAIDYQYDAFAAFKSVMNEIAAGDQRAFDALDAGSYAQWDAYWTDEYPKLVDKLKTAAEDVDRSEQYIHSLIYGIDPAARDAATPKLWWTIPVWLTAAAVALYIYNEEQKRAAAAKQAPTQSDTDAFIEARKRYWAAQGLAPIAASTRAIAEAGQVRALQGTQIGIEHAKDFVTETGLKPAVKTLLPPQAKSALSIKSILDKLSKIGREIQIMLTSKECRTEAAPKSLAYGAAALLEPGAAPATKANGTCAVYFCSTLSDECPNVPAGDWDAVVVADGHLRDIALDVAVAEGTTTSLDASPTPVADIGTAPAQAQCSAVQNAGGDTADTRIVQLGQRSGSFTFSHDMVSIKDRMLIYYDGAPILDTGCVSGKATHTVPFSGLSTVITVQVEPNCSGPTTGTYWSYSIGCPAK